MPRRLLSVPVSKSLGLIPHLALGCGSQRSNASRMQTPSPIQSLHHHSRSESDSDHGSRGVHCLRRRRGLPGILSNGGIPSSTGNEGMDHQPTYTVSTYIFGGRSIAFVRHSYTCDQAILTTLLGSIHTMHIFPFFSSPLSLQDYFIHTAHLSFRFSVLLSTEIILSFIFHCTLVVVYQPLVARFVISFFFVVVCIEL